MTPSSSKETKEKVNQEEPSRHACEMLQFEVLKHKSHLDLFAKAVAMEPMIAPVASNKTGLGLLLGSPS